MNQAVFLFDNQYQPKTIDRVYHRIRETTWDHCINIQKSMCQHHIIGGPLTDFKVDEALNSRMGFPAGSYTTFIKRRLLQGNQKYILEHFVRGKESLTLRDMLQNNRFTSQFIFHIADYVFMNLQVRITQTGSYLIIPIGTADGISSSQMEKMMANYDNPYTPSRWTLEIRPKVSYAYGEGTVLTMITNSNRIYLNQFTEQKQYYKSEEINDWKVCMSVAGLEQNLLRATVGNLMFDDAGLPYIEVSTTFAEYISQATFNVRCFLYNEGRKTGFTISPNYIGPSQYLKTTFDEYIDTVDAQRLKVVAMDLEGGWVSLGGVDKQFGSLDDLVTVGFTTDQCWISIPTKQGVPPIYPGNFRVWEYDAETDTLGRMVATDMEAAFPNIYFYKMQSDCSLLYIEWFRDDETVGTDYDDFSKGYRDYIGTGFYIDMVNGNAIAALKEFTPLHSVYDSSDFVENILRYSSHEYRVERLSELLKETGLHYDEIIDALDSENAGYTTIIYKMEDMPNLYQRIQNGAPNGTICIGTSENYMRPYDLYIDGLHVSDTSTSWMDFHQYITVPSAKVLPNSTIIIDLYDYAEQFSATVKVNGSYNDALIPWDFPLEKICGNEITVSKTDGTRIPPQLVNFGLYAMEYLIQVPEKMIDWDKLGISIDSDVITDRVGTDTRPDGDFKSVVFRFIVPTEFSYYFLKTVESEQLVTSDGEDLMVKAGDVFISTKDLPNASNGTINKFGRRVKAHDITIMVDEYDKTIDLVNVQNNNIRRISTNVDLSTDNTVTITAFNGADDPSRLMPFVNGQLVFDNEVEGTIPEKMNSDFQIRFINSHNAGDIGEVVYLPFATDRFDIISDENSELRLQGTNVMVIGVHDIIFEDGYRIPNDQLVRVTNQIVKTPKPNAVYTIIRTHRDSNMFGFEDTETQSILDRILLQSPGYRQSLGVGGTSGATN